MKLRNATVLMILLGLTVLPASVLAVTPPPKVNPLAGPGKQMADAKAKLDVAKAQITVIKRKVLVVFEAKPEWKSAREGADRAKADFDAQGRLLSAGLVKNPAYKALIARRDKDEAIISPPASSSSGGDDSAKISPEDLAAAKQDRTAAVLEMKAMEKSAQDTDPSYAAMKVKYDEARTALEALDKQVDEAVKLDPGYDTAKQGVEAAEAAYKAARDAYQIAAKAQHDADANKSKTPRR